MNNTKRPTLKPWIRCALQSDIKHVAKIESNCFEHPWSSHDFVRVLMQPNILSMVAEYNDEIVGFMVYSVIKRGYVLENLAVKTEYQLKGAGRALIQKLKNNINRGTPRVGISAVIRESNLDAQLFFRSCGFRCSEVLRGYWEETGEDGYLFGFGEFEE